MRTDESTSKEDLFAVFLLKLKMVKFVLTVGFDFGGDIFRRLLKIVIVFRRTSDGQL